MTTDWDSLSDALRRDLQEYGGLLNLLGQQQAAILDRDPDMVMAVAEMLEKQVEIMEQCRLERELWVKRLAFQYGQTSDATLKSVTLFCPAPIRPLLTALIDEINSLIARSRRLANQNKLLLARSVEVALQLMNRLYPDGFLQTYNHRGKANVSATGAQTRPVTLT